MGNPFRILKLLFRASRPSRIATMSVVVDSTWLKRGYQAMTFFGTIVTATEADAQMMRCENDSLHRHETIHLRQAQSIHDSWVLFYLLYAWYFIKALPQNRHMKNAAYYLNPFEMEAYLHDGDEHYIEQLGPEGATEWRTYAKMSAKERKTIVAKIFRKS